ncbi:MAG TPA: hypothetical protein VGQ52_15765 [Gemmatimonadaceae bacterium]|nr:hypothetical protein [Gemmatimonadaceae bacterium]
MAKSRYLAFLLAFGPMLASAQEISGSGSGPLSERTYCTLLYRGRSDSSAIEIVLILRGQPGWANRRRGGGASLSSRVGPIRAGGRAPVRYSLTLRSSQFEFSYEPEGRILRFGDAWYPLEDANVVILDDVDFGAPHIIGRFSIPFGPVSRHKSPAEVLRRVPELQEFIR